MSDSFFFQDNEVEEIAQYHAEKIKSLSDRETEKMLKTYKRVRQELSDRLDMVSPGTFTAQKMQGTLLQIQLAIKQMNKGLLTDMGDAAGLAADLGIENLIKELSKWNKKFTGAVTPINFDAAKVALDTKNFAFNRYEASIEAYGGMVAQRMAYALTDSVIAQDNLNDVISGVRKGFMGEEWKLQQIARTELHNVYSQGKLNTMSDLWDEGKGDIPDLKKTLFHPMDSRTGKDSIRLSKDNPIVSIDEPFIEYSTGKRLEYMAPPNRPNDRAILIPYRDAWRSR